MSRLLDRLLMWIADVLDGSVLTVPELRDDWPRSNGLTYAANTSSCLGTNQAQPRLPSVLAGRFTPHRKAHNDRYAAHTHHD